VRTRSLTCDGFLYARRGQETASEVLGEEVVFVSEVLGEEAVFVLAVAAVLVLVQSLALYQRFVSQSLMQLTVVYVTMMFDDFLKDWWGSCRFRGSWRFWDGHRRRGPLISSNDDFVLVPPVVIVVLECDIIVVSPMGFPRSFTKSLLLPSTAYHEILFLKSTS